HDILKEDHLEKHQALVRIEDVNPESNPEYLRAIANFLGSENIPFSVGLTPFYLDPSTNTAISLTDRPDLVKAIQYIISKGGTVVLHGCTHQYRGETTVDYEFWDEFNDQPIFEDSREYVRIRIEKALNECLQNKIHPLAWETPHYAASLSDYDVINQYFSTSYERRQTMDISGTDQLLPFLIPANHYKNQIIPENLGYIPVDDPSPENMILNAKNNLAVRDGFASFFFHPFVELNVLKELVKSIQELGYTFTDIRSLNNKVISPNHIIVSGEAEIALNVQDKYFNEFYITNNGKTKDQNISKDKLSGNITKYVDCPSGSIYIAQSTDTKSLGFPSNIWSSVSKSPLKIGSFFQSQPLTGINSLISAIILVDPDADGELLISQLSFLNAFKTIGIDYQMISVADFFETPENINLIVLPNASAVKLSEQQILFTMNALSRGLNIILENESSLTSRLGIIPRGNNKSVNTVRDEYYPQIDIHWAETGEYRNFDASIEYITYYSEVNTGDPIVIGGEYGEGKYLYFASLFDPTTSKGYGRYPYFPDLIQRQFSTWPLVKKECVEIYFEPGDREDVSIEDLVKMWKKNGFRKIYIAGWHIYPDWTYDYERLITLAHQNAMLVYLWLELPHVNDKFWEEHPEWREITATGDTAIINWRHLMAFTDDSCMKTVMTELSTIIQQYNWDGINLAELYFGSPFGPEQPELFTPMHPSARKLFQSQYTFDPIQLFNENSPYFWKKNNEKWKLFEIFRTNLLVQFHKEFLQLFYQLNKQSEKDMEIVITVLDNILAKETGKGTGIDTKSLIELSNEYPFTLQIEDPQELWYMGSSRYDSLSQTYYPMVSNNKLIFDINIAPYRSYREILAPTQTPTGLELFGLIQSAQQKNNDVALYSESSIYMVDLPWIAYTLGNQSKETFLSPYQWQIQSENTVTFDLNPQIHKDIQVNGSLWPAYYNGRATLPPGTHIIQPLSQRESLVNKIKTATRLIDISGELESCKLLSRGIELSYKSDVKNYVIINEKPQKVYVDDAPYNAEIVEGIQGFSIKLPPGSHQVRVLTSSFGSTSLKNMSIVISVFIVSLSTIAGSVLFILYLTGYKRRRSKNKQHNRRSV
ncbi:polysaccharide deacetylase family protein, partial [bacterium]|nr:polysaccharide deacetylase family protein [bacterium]